MGACADKDDITPPPSRRRSAKNEKQPLLGNQTVKSTPPESQRTSNDPAQHGDNRNRTADGALSRGPSLGPGSMISTASSSRVSHWSDITTTTTDNMASVQQQLLEQLKKRLEKNLATQLEGHRQQMPAHVIEEHIAADDEEEEQEEEVEPETDSTVYTSEEPSEKKAVEAAVVNESKTAKVKCEHCHRHFSWRNLLKFVQIFRNHSGIPYRFIEQKIFAKILEISVHEVTIANCICDI